LNRNKINGGNPEMLIIIKIMINFINGVSLIQEGKFEGE